MGHGAKSLVPSSKFQVSSLKRIAIKISRKTLNLEL